MTSWFGWKAPPPRVPTDIVVPLRYWDDTALLKNTVLFTMSRYDAALDAEKLYNSLERLVARKGWRKLGARLRKNVSDTAIYGHISRITDYRLPVKCYGAYSLGQAQGNIEYHIPIEFTKERPAVSFSQDRYDIPISDHPLASQLPKASTRPAVVGDPVQFTPFTRPPGTPSSLDDYLTQDRGQLGLHVVSFMDATLVCLYFSHTAFDLIGWGALLTAWTHELHGRGEQIQTPAGGDPADGDECFDPMRDLGTNPTWPHALEGRHMGLVRLFWFFLRNAYDFLWREKECRIVCVPGAFVNQMHAGALEELGAEAVKSGEEMGGETFVSRGDVLAAWWARVLASSVCTADSERTIMIQVCITRIHNPSPPFQDQNGLLGWHPTTSKVTGPASSLFNHC